MNLFFRKYFEALVFSIGLLLLALMDPASANGPSLCLFDQLGILFCPGEGLGHSIAYVFRGEIYNSIEANALGPIAILVISGRILYLLFINTKNYK